MDYSLEIEISSQHWKNIGQLAYILIGKNLSLFYASYYSVIIKMIIIIFNAKVLLLTYCK